MPHSLLTLRSQCLLFLKKTKLDAQEHEIKRLKRKHADILDSNVIDTPKHGTGEQALVHEVPQRPIKRRRTMNYTSDHTFKEPLMDAKNVKPKKEPHLIAAAVQPTTNCQVVEEKENQHNLEIPSHTKWELASLNEYGICHRAQ